MPIELWKLVEEDVTKMRFKRRPLDYQHAVWELFHSTATGDEDRTQ